MSYERDNIRQLSAYTPGEQPGEVSVVKLNTNENPYPPAEAVLRAVREVSAERLRRYPPPEADAFRRLAAQVHGVAAEQVIATNGGDELLRLAVTVFCEPVVVRSQESGVRSQGAGVKRSYQTSSLKPQASGLSAGGLGVAEPSYSLYPVLAAIQQTPITRIPLGPAFDLPEDFAAGVIKVGCRLAMIVNPHAPSGRLEPLDKLEQIARQLMGWCVLLIDEAYVDFAANDALALLEPKRGLDNVLLLRSLSKGYSLAGLRFGYGLGAPGIIAALNKAKDSYPTDALAQAAAAAALQSREQAGQTWQRVIAERGRVIAELRRRGWDVPDSQSNFILAKPPPPDSRASAGRTDARTIYELLKRNNILVRYFDQDRLRDRLRITIGTPAQNDTLLAALNAQKGLRLEA